MFAPLPTFTQNGHPISVGSVENQLLNGQARPFWGSGFGGYGLGGYGGYGNGGYGIGGFSPYGYNNLGFSGYGNGNFTGIYPGGYWNGYIGNGTGLSDMGAASYYGRRYPYNYSDMTAIPYNDMRAGPIYTSDMGAIDAGMNQQFNRVYRPKPKKPVHKQEYSNSSHQAPSSYTPSQSNSDTPVRPNAFWRIINLIFNPIVAFVQSLTGYGDFSTLYAQRERDNPSAEMPRPPLYDPPASNIGIASAPQPQSNFAALVPNDNAMQNTRLAMQSTGDKSIHPLSIPRADNPANPSVPSR